MNDFKAQIAAQNKALREAKEATLVVEHLVCPTIQKMELTEADGSKTTGYRVAKVAHADRMNQNHRVYPRKEWEAQVRRANEELIPAGKLIGAVDHASWGGNLKDSPILWKKLELKADGAIEGEFLVIRNHSRGADLQAQLDAGMAIGFSTSGYAKAREPSADERKQYGIPENDEDAVILEFYTLKKIDAVDDPSVIDAWTKESTHLVETDMNDLNELKAKFPGVHALHVQAVEAAVGAVQLKLDAQIKAACEQSTKIAGLESKVTELTAALAKADALRAYLTDAVTKLGAEHAVPIPYAKPTEQQTVEQIDALTKAGVEKAKTIADLQAKVDAAEKEKAEAAAKAADLQRQTDVKAKVESLLKGSRFAEQINKAVERSLADKAFDLKAAEALVAAKTEEYEAVAKFVPTAPALGITGITSLKQNDQQGEGASQDEPLPIAKEMAQAL